VGGCTPATGLLGADTLALSPDGKTLYVGTIRLGESDREAGSVVALAVNASAGTLSPITGHGGCLGEGPVSGCDAGRGMLGITSVIAPDNGTVYAVGNFSSSVVVLRRASNGRIFQPSTGTAGADGCTSATGQDDCATAPSLSGARAAVASHDGFHLYVAGGSTVSGFLREGRGRLVQLQSRYGCVGQGRTASKCSPSHGLADAQAIAIDPLDRYVYVATAGAFGATTPGGGIVTLKRNAAPPPLTITAKLKTVSCHARRFVMDLRAKSPLPVQLSATIDGHSVGTLPKGSSLRLYIQAGVYKLGLHHVKAKVRDITGRVRNTSASFRRCRSL
jgi:DNA-binding beta-propeller fold protein YncE